MATFKKQQLLSGSSALYERLNPFTMEPMYQLMLLAFGGSIGMTFIFLACALPQYNCWLPLCVVMLYVLAPFPTLIARRYSEGFLLGETTNSKMHWAIFFTMFFVVTSFALPIYLTRFPMSNPSIKVGACCLTISGGIIIYVTIVLFFLMFLNENEV